MDVPNDPTALPLTSVIHNTLCLGNIPVIKVSDDVMAVKLVVVEPDAELTQDAVAAHC